MRHKKGQRGATDVWAGREWGTGRADKGKWAEREWRKGGAGKKVSGSFGPRVQRERKLLGVVNGDRWEFETDSGEYLKNGVVTNDQPPPSHRFYAEGPGTHALAHAMANPGALVKATDYLSYSEMTPAWQGQLRKMRDDQARLGQANLRFIGGRRKGNVLDADKTGGLSSHQYRRLHDLMQMTFPRGATALDRPQDAEQEDVGIALGFLTLAFYKLKDGGEARIVLMNSPFYHRYMQIVLADPFVQNNFDYRRRDVGGTYDQAQPFEDARQQGVDYRHRMTGSAQAPGAAAAGDVIHEFVRRPR